MPLTNDICAYLYCWFLIWGRGTHASKGDLRSAFRLLWLNLNDPTQVGYRFDGKLIQDLRDIWGSRSGSKHTQEVGRLIGRYFNLKSNPHWDQDEIMGWMRVNELGIWCDVLRKYVTNGIDLATLKRDAAWDWKIEEDVLDNRHTLTNLIRRDALFEKIARLKLSSGLYPVVLNDNYVDDHFLFTPPLYEPSVELFRVFGELDWFGMGLFRNVGGSNR
eukprot:105108_1